MRLCLGEIKTRRISTPQGPSQVLTDKATGASLEIPLPGNTNPYVTELVISSRERERVCMKKPMAFVSVPSKELPGEESRLLMCCLKGSELVFDPARQREVCEPKKNFVPIVIQHPKALAERLRREIETGALQIRRVGIRRRIKAARR